MKLGGSVPSTDLGVEGSPSSRLHRKCQLPFVVHEVFLIISSQPSSPKIRVPRDSGSLTPWATDPLHCRLTPKLPSQRGALTSPPQAVGL